MREPADAERIERFLAALAFAATAPTTVYLVGGASAMLVGWRAMTRDIDMVIIPAMTSPWRFADCRRSE